MAGGGGGKTTNTTSSNAPQTTLSATGTAGDVANIAGGTYTQNILDSGAIQAAFSGNMSAITSTTNTLNHAIDNNTADLANLINFAAGTQMGAADLISKSIGLAAAATGANSKIVDQLSTANSPGMPASTPVSATTLGAFAVAGVVLYIVFKG